MHMNTRSSWFGRSKVAKAVILLVAFLFTLTSVSPAFAQEAEVPLVSEPSIETPIVPDQTQVDPIEETAPTEELPADPNQEASPKEEIPEEKPKEEPQPEALSMVGPISMLDEISEPGSRLSSDIDQVTGAFIYKYTIAVPPGRNNMTPDVELTYNSADSTRDSVIGSGWEVKIPYIERINRTGSNALYTDNYFVSSLDGELLSTGTGTYAAKNENGNFLTYSLSSNVWTVTDKTGRVYKFGTNAAERQDNSADTSKVFKWMLQEVRDTNDNYIKYEYYKDAGQIYPSKITYTGNGSTDGILEVNFDRTSRSNAPALFKTGFSVKSNYRISEIRTEINDVWARKYALTYVAGDNGYGSLLDTITESGQDESSNVTTLPATNFDYNTAATDWTYSSSFSQIQPFLNNGVEQGMRTGDINGDGIVDFLCHNEQNNNGCSKTNRYILVSNGGGWSSASWDFPTKADDATKKESFLNSSGADTGLRIMDVNGDNLADLVRANGNANNTGRYTYINNGAGWTYNSSWNLPMGFIDGGTDFGMRMADINGDGLPDIICHNNNNNGACSRYNATVMLNTGSGWTSAGSWAFPTKVDDSSRTEFFTTSTYADAALRVFDVNGDGLADLVRATDAQSGGGEYTYINNGSGWTYDSAWEMSFGFTPDYGVRVSDFNGDGLSDFLCHNEQNNVACSKLNPVLMTNKGFGGWQSATGWDFPVKAYDATKTEVFLSSTLADTGLRVLDVNADGMDDLVKSYSYTQSSYTYLNNETFPSNFLTNITYSEGGSTAVTYKSSAQFKDGSGNLLNPNMPVISHVVSQISNSDGLGLTATNTYEYEGGRYYFNTYLDRKFAGFNKITKTNAAGNKVINYFHQGNTTDTSNGEYSDHASKIGKVYRTEIQDSSGNIYSKTINKWDKYDLGSGRNFVKNVRTTELTYDGDSDHKDKVEEYTYDNTYGNLTEKIEYGEVTASNDGSFTDTGSDKFTTTMSYAVNTTPYIVGLLSQDTLVDQSSTKVKENKYYYDGQSLGSVTDGNLTKQEMWKDSTNYIDIEKTYNTTYGIVTQEKDARDKATNYSYDSYNLYPATVTNPLSQATSYTYDYSSGQVKQITDANSRVYQKVYDGMDRVKEEKVPDLSTPSTLVTKTAYAYTDTSGAVKVQKTDYLDGSTSVDTYSYFDGLHRPIQTRKEMEDGSYSVTDTVYNNIGQVYKESMPYSSSGSSKTSPTTTSALLATNSYDAMLRITSTVNAVGTISNAYDDWKVTVTDAKGKTKDMYKDGYDNLIKVDEHNSSSTYTTNYEYNGNGKLTKITDALSNVRNFTYDGLGRQLTAQDLHASGDGTFGTWTYTYDAAGNVTTIVDPNAQTINYTYDDINRKATEDYTGTGGTEVTYTYDSGTDGVGKLTSAAAPGANTAYAYNPNGGLKQEIKTLNSVGYQTDYTYDRQGNKLEITNPDSSKIKYTYNTAGQAETVQRKESTDGSFINVVTDIDYGPHGKMTYEEFQNGSATTNTYDSSKLYRLSNKTTTITGGSKVQDLTYTYDNNGNVTKIVDASNTNASKTVDYTYDDLNRLLSATATAVASGQSTYTHNYTYSAIGNILTRTDVAGTYTYAGDTGSNYANPHAVTSVGSITYTYDNNGNMLTETSGLSNTWDYNNRLSQAIKGGVTSTYAYDFMGQRVKVANGTSTTYYPSQFYNTDGTNIIKHITTPDGQTVATIKGTGGSAAAYSLHTDHLTGSSVITNSGGTQEELMDYFPYGNIRLDQKAGSYDEQRKFTGYEHDADTGLDYANARYYHSAIGRFTSQDPIFLQAGFDLSDPQGMNSYAYARNNPLRYIDPNGKWFMDLIRGRQSWSDFTVEVGDAASYLYNNSRTWKTAMDHPYATGAVVGVAGGLAAAGAVAAGPAVATAATRVASQVTPQVAVRAATGAALNVASTALQAQVERRPVSGWEYLSSAGIGAVSANVGGKWYTQGAVAGVGSAAQQITFNFDKGFVTQAGISAMSTAAVAKMFGIPGITSTPQVYNFITESVVVFTVDTPIQVIKSGVENSEKDKKDKKGR